MMNRRAFSTALTASAALCLFSATAKAQPLRSARNVVLVHGLYADGSCWTKVIRRVQDAGLNATAVQWPTTTLDDAVTETRRVLALQNGPTVLVGHSFGGTIVTEAGTDPNVSALVFIAARAPEVGEDIAEAAKSFPRPPVAAGLIYDGDFGRLNEEAFLRDFAGDLPREEAAALYAVQKPFHKALLAGRTTTAAWKLKPSYYAVSTQDRTIDPDFERFMAKRSGAETVEIASSHVPMISRPEDVANLILKAAGHQR